MGPLIRGLFSIVNTVALHVPWLVDATNVEEQQIGRDRV